jgi:hypothetical protein
MVVNISGYVALGAIEGAAAVHAHSRAIVIGVVLDEHSAVDCGF